MTRPNEPSRPALNRRVIALHLGSLLLLAWLLYAPWVSVPFPMLDYSEFLQPLRRSTSFAGGFAELAAYYRSHGRTSYLAYLQLAANWSIFGARPTAWNIMVFGYMYAAVAAVWLLLIRLGNTAVTATLAAGLLMLATPAIPGWLRPSGEPLALMFFCVALASAWTYQSVRDWRGHAAVIVLAILGIGLAKDLLTPLAIIPVVVACCRDNGFRRPRPSSRNLVLSAAAALVIVTLAALIVSAQIGRLPNAYTGAYRLNNVSPEWLVTVFSLMLLPATASFTPPQMTANAAFLVALAAGWTLRADRQESGRWHQPGSWLGFILLGALLYSPVAWFSPLYGLPFVLGSAVLFGGALARAVHAPAVWRRTVQVSAALVLAIAAGSAFNAARVEMAERRLNGQISRLLRGVDVDSIMIAVPTVNPWTWAQQSAVLRRYALDNGDLARDVAGTRDISCESVRALARARSRVLLINAAEGCGALPFAADDLEEPYIMLNPLPAERRRRAQYVLLSPATSEPPPPQQWRSPSAPR